MGPKDIDNDEDVQESVTISFTVPMFNFTLALDDPPSSHELNMVHVIEAESELLWYPQNLHPLYYLLSFHDQARIWHNQVHLTSRKQIEADFPSKYDDTIKHYWKKVKFTEHREWERQGKAKLLEKPLNENEIRIECIRKSNIGKQKFDGLLGERMEEDRRRDYDVRLNSPPGVAGNALEVLRALTRSLAQLGPFDFFGLPLGHAGHGHYQEEIMPKTLEVPLLIDLSRCGRPLPIVLFPDDIDRDALLAKKQTFEEVYSESIGDPCDPVIPLFDSIFPHGLHSQLDGSSESKHVTYELPYAQRSPRSHRPKLKGPLVISLPEFGSLEEEYEQAFKAFGVEFLARMLQNPKYLFEMLKYADQEEHGTLNTENLVKLIFKVAEWDWPPSEKALRWLSEFARFGVDEAKQIPTAEALAAGAFQHSPTKSAAEDENQIEITPDRMLEFLSRSFVVPVSGYYYDVEEAVFRALMEKTKEVVELVRPDFNGKVPNDPKLNEEVTAKRRDLQKWMTDLYEGAKQERTRSQLTYEKRAQRWRKMWNAIVRDGENEAKALKAFKAPLVDEILMEYIKLNPGKRPFPGAPAPRLPFDGEDNDQSQAPRNELSHGRADFGQLGLPRTVNQKGLPDIIRNSLVVDPGTGARNRAKKENVDGALDEHSPERRLSRSSLPDGTQDDLAEIHPELPQLEIPGSSPAHVINVHNHVEPHKTVLKHPHIGLNRDSSLVNLSERRGQAMHVRIVLPSDEPHHALGGLTGQIPEMLAHLYSVDNRVRPRRKSGSVTPNVRPIKELESKCTSLLGGFCNSRAAPGLKSFSALHSPEPGEKCNWDFAPSRILYGFSKAWHKTSGVVAAYAGPGIGIAIGYSLTTYITTQWDQTFPDRWVLKSGGFQGSSPQSSGPGEKFLPIDFLACGAVIPDGSLGASLATAKSAY
ncbi:hypothetical protein BDZ91DRAFT_760077 [Kalaharituber pfeilii]|nr:hypothetical protein BDZ91DRAFT_760077 [Kalaharituber pfeilii]